MRRRAVRYLAVLQIELALSPYELRVSESFSARVPGLWVSGAGEGVLVVARRVAGGWAFLTGDGSFVAPCGDMACAARRLGRRLDLPLGPR